MSKVNGLEPSGPFVEGFIRFIWEGDENGVGRQGEGFELLAHTHAASVSEQEGPAQLDTHPMTDGLPCRDSEKQEGRRHLDEVPIYFLGGTTDQVLRAEYRAYDVFGNVLCKGDGCSAQRNGEQTACAGPRGCGYAKSVGCQLHVRMQAAVEGSADPYAVFEFQSTSPNTYRTLKAKLLMFEQIAGSLMGLPLRLTTWKKSTKASEYKVFYCANIQLREGETLEQAKSAATKTRTELGLDAFKGYSLDSEDGTLVDDVVSIKRTVQPAHPKGLESQTAEIMSNLVAASKTQLASRADVAITDVEEQVDTTGRSRTFPPLGSAVDQIVSI